MMHFSGQPVVPSRMFLNMWVSFTMIHFRVTSSMVIYTHTFTRKEADVCTSWFYNTRYGKISQLAYIEKCLKLSLLHERKTPYLGTCLVQCHNYMSIKFFLILLKDDVSLSLVCVIAYVLCLCDIFRERW